MKKWVVTFIGCAGLLGSYAQQTDEQLFQQGLQAEQAGNDAEAFGYYRQAAEMGNVAAQCNLGLCYELGRGVAQNDEQAVYWYRLSAGQGDFYAQCNLGLCYEFGRGLQQDREMAKYWYDKSARQGYARAQFRIGELFYEDGDNGQALYWYGKTAESEEQERVPEAQYMLGIIHFKYGDYAQAFDWLSKAAAAGDLHAAIGVGVCYRDGKGVSADTGQAVALFNKVHKAGEALWHKGETEENTSGEEFWRTGFDIAARAARQLCYCYYKGRGVKKDWEKAAEYALLYEWAGRDYGLGLDNVFLSENSYEEMLQDLSRTKYYILHHTENVTASEGPAM